ncbi:MAG: universal stress protein [Candidatus Sericytochromatia bacterium]|nr:MAG: universal stress protein [Candidatus Sericytochromatia bacterium]
MFKKILLPIDGSENSKKATNYVLELSKKFNSKVYVLNSYEMPAIAMAPPAGAVSHYRLNAEIEQNLKEYSQKILNECAKIFKDNNIDVETIMLKGEPGPKIVETAEQYNCDLVVIGNRGLGSVKSILLGSVSNYVVHHIKFPILLIH